MDRFITLFPATLYHSYIIEGRPESAAKELEVHLKTRRDVGFNTADFMCHQYQSCTVHDVSEIKEWYYTKAVADGKRICIIAALYINREAEQALLKIIEEPHPSTHFFLVVPNASLLLETLRSRTQVLTLVDEIEITIDNPALMFVNAIVSKRIEIITALIEKYKNSETSGALRFEATTLLNKIEEIMHEKFKKNKIDTTTQFVLHEIQKNRTYLDAPGASVKMILEHIALVI